MENRDKILSKLNDAVEAREWEQCSDVCFQLLYNLPPEFQIELGIYMMHRYLPIYEKKHPDDKIVDSILKDLDSWTRKHGRQLPDKFGENSDIADNAFFYGIDSILLAHSYQHDSRTLTTSVCCAIISSIQAMRDNVWITDDPEAVKMWEDGNVPLARTVLNNKASLVTEQNEWRELYRRLVQENVGNYPMPSEPKSVAMFLNDWKENEYLLIIPKQ
jgi:hypothetical protein